MSSMRGGPSLRNRQGLRSNPKMRKAAIVIACEHPGKTMGLDIPQKSPNVVPDDAPIWWFNGARSCSYGPMAYFLNLLDPNILSAIFFEQSIRFREKSPIRLKVSWLTPRHIWNIYSAESQPSRQNPSGWIAVIYIISWTAYVIHFLWALRCGRIVSLLWRIQHFVRSWMIVWMIGVSDGLPQARWMVYSGGESKSKMDDDDLGVPPF